MSVRKKILVIDDEEILTKTFARLLGRLDYDVRVATRPEDAVTIAGKEALDLIISDIRMPGKNGIETVTEIKAGLTKQGRSDVPVIFLTGFADQKLEEQAQSLNPVAYVYKPFDVQELLSLINTRLAAK